MSVPCLPEDVEGGVTQACPPAMRPYRQAADQACAAPGRRPRECCAATDAAVQVDLGTVADLVEDGRQLFERSHRMVERAAAMVDSDDGVGAGVDDQGASVAVWTLLTTSGPSRRRAARSDRPGLRQGRTRCSTMPPRAPFVLVREANVSGSVVTGSATRRGWGRCRPGCARSVPAGWSAVGRHAGGRPDTGVSTVRRGRRDPAGGRTARGPRWGAITPRYSWNQRSVRRSRGRD